MDFVDEDLFKLAPDYNKQEMFKSVTAKHGIRSLLNEEGNMQDDLEFEMAVGVEDLELEPQSYSGN
jgi:hypothetical protein